MATKRAPDQQFTRARRRWDVERSQLHGQVVSQVASSQALSVTGVVTVGETSPRIAVTVLLDATGIIALLDVDQGEQLQFSGEDLSASDSFAVQGIQESEV